VDDRSAPNGRTGSPDWNVAPGTVPGTPGNKRLRYSVQHDREALNSALRIFLDELERHLQAQSPGAGRDARAGALVPPPRQHRHRYYGVLAPNAPLRAAVTALAPEAVVAQPMETSGEEPTEMPLRSPARYLWAMLLARILRGVSPELPRVWGRDADYCLRYRDGPGTTDSGAHRRAMHAAEDCPGTRTSAGGRGRGRDHHSR
jgi:hypothetical protein